MATGNLSADIKAKLEELEDTWSDYHMAVLNPYSSVKRITKKINYVAVLIDKITQQLEAAKIKSDDFAPFRQIKTAVDGEVFAWKREEMELNAAQAYPAYAFRDEVYTIWGVERADNSN